MSEKSFVNSESIVLSQLFYVLMSDTSFTGLKPPLPELSGLSVLSCFRLSCEGFDLIGNQPILLNPVIRIVSGSKAG